MTGTYYAQMALSAHGQPLNGPERPILHIIEDHMPSPSQGQDLNGEETLETLDPVNEESYPESLQELPEDYHDMPLHEISFPDLSFAEETFNSLPFPEVFPEDRVSEETFFEDMLPVPVQGQPLHSSDASVLHSLDEPLLHTFELPQPGESVYLVIESCIF